MDRRSRFPAPSTLTYLIGVPTCALAANLAYRDSTAIDFPGPLPTALAIALTVSFLLLAAESYARLVAPALRTLARRSFLSSQLIKYVPAGGLAQFASQAGQLGLPGGGGIRVVVESKLIAAAGGLVWGFVFAAFADDASIALRVAAALAGLLGLIMWTPWFVSLVRRLAVRLGATADDPVARRPLTSLILAVLSVGAAGAGFVVLLGSQGSAGPSALVAAAAYALAWTVGYLAVPFPGGIGVREATLVLLLPLELATVVLVAVATRLIQVGCELVLGLLIVPMTASRRRT